MATAASASGDPGWSRRPRRWQPRRAVQYIDLRLGNTCNMQCVMCQPRESSRWLPTARRLSELCQDPELKADVERQVGDRLRALPVVPQSRVLGAPANAAAARQGADPRARSPPALGCRRGGLRQDLDAARGPLAMAVATARATASSKRLWEAMLVALVAETCITVLIVIWITLVQRLVPQELLGRVSSLDWMISTAGVPLSFALIGPASDAFGVDATLIGAGVLGAAMHDRVHVLSGRPRAGARRLARGRARRGARDGRRLGQARPSTLPIDCRGWTTAISGRLGLKVSPLCLGTMNFGPRDDGGRRASRSWTAALELGINFFDTANVYGWKEGEGRPRRSSAAGSRRAAAAASKVVIATKVYGEMGDWPNDVAALRAAHPPRVRGEPAAPADRPHRPVPDAPRRPATPPGTRSGRRWRCSCSRARSSTSARSNFARLAHRAGERDRARRGTSSGLVSEQSLYNLADRMVELEVIPACARPTASA